MSEVKLWVESIFQDGFYVPQFEIRIAGSGLPRDVLRDVKELTYKDDITTIDSFEITVNNWDPDTQQFKYVGAETDADLKDESPTNRHRLFEPCNKTVEVLMGYMGDLHTMVQGNFTAIEPSFPSSGASTLTVRGLNVLHALRRKQYTYAWLGLRDSEIVENLATLTDQGVKRFPLPIKTDPTAKLKEPQIPIVSQKNQYDIEFLLGRARERGYVVYVQEANKKTGTPRRLYFGPSDGTQPTQIGNITYVLEWNKSLIDFKPTFSTARQVKSVTVNGWDPDTNRVIHATVDLNDRELTRNRDLYDVLQKCDPRDEIVVDEPVRTDQQARRRAIAILDQMQKKAVEASGSTVGLPDLRAGQRVRIDGVGARFSGVYFVTSTTHTLNDAGYTTRFNARREEPSGGAA